MRISLAATVCGAVFLPVLFAQKAGGTGEVLSPIDTRGIRELESRAHENSGTGKGGSAAVPWTSLSSEEGDDPTIGATAIPAHDVPKAAKKAAGKAEHHARKGQHEEAITEFRAALDIDPKYYEAENNLALELEAVGKTVDAEKTLRHLMESAPEHTLAFTNLATLLCERKRYADAEAVVRECLQHHRFSFKTNYLLGAALVDEGKWTDEAREKLQYAEVRYPEAKELLEKWPANR